MDVNTVIGICYIKEQLIKKINNNIYNNLLSFSKNISAGFLLHFEHNIFINSSFLYKISIYIIPQIC